VLGNSQLRAGAFLGFILGGAGFGRCGRGLGLSQRLGSDGRVNVLGALGVLRQDGDDVGADLGESALDEKAPHFRAALEAKFAEAQAPDQRRPARKDAKLTVVHR
jgi:hypothetical protein